MWGEGRRGREGSQKTVGADRTAEERRAGVLCVECGATSMNTWPVPILGSRYDALVFKENVERNRVGALRQKRRRRAKYFLCVPAMRCGLCIRHTATPCVQDPAEAAEGLVVGRSGRDCARGEGSGETMTSGEALP